MATLGVILLAILLFVLAYIIYAISLGQVDITPDSPIGESLEEKKKKAEEEHQRLVREIAAQEELKFKLQRRFRRIYLAARLVFAGLLAGYNLFLYFYCKVRELGDLLSWNELLLIAFIAFNFVCYGSLSNFNSLIRYFKNKIENWVYRNHTDLDDKIKQNKDSANRIFENRV